MEPAPGPSDPVPPFGAEIRAIHERLATLRGGTVADYIPELGKADPDAFGIAVTTVDGAVIEAGDSRAAFTIQSISKPFTFGLALEDHGREAVLARVGVEPTGDAFNSIMIDEESRRPFNPMVNAGAIVTTGLVAGADADERRARLLAFMSRFAGRDLAVDEAVLASERSTGDRNRAIGYLMRGFAMLDDVDAVLDLYFRQCSVLVTCADLATMAATLANGGVNPVTGVRALDATHVEGVLSVMATCGMYDFAGEWLLTVGLPAKSGVAGGVIAVLPGQVGIGVFSPPLDRRGNSVRGIAVCQELTRAFDLHQYHPGLVSTDAVVREYDGETVRSRRTRGPEESALLDREGHRIVVLKLRGDLTFGSAERLTRRLGSRLADGVGWVILDLLRVAAVDGAAWSLLRRLTESAAERGARVIASYADPGVPGIEAAVDTDDALERCEDDLLAGLGITAAPDVALADQPLFTSLGPADARAIAAVAETRSFAAGETVFAAGDPGDAVYLVSSGVVRAELEIEGSGRMRRLQSMGPGVAFGELALLDRGTRSASVVAETDAVLHVLGADGLAAAERAHPGATAELYRGLGRLLSERLRRATAQIRVLDG